MSRYRNYAMENNVSSELYAPLWVLATSVQVNSWQWQRRGSNFPILATIESFDSTWKCIKREWVEITAISWDVFTIRRKAFPCLANDDANIQGQSSFDFNIWDKISLYIPKEIIARINDAIDDIYDNWDDRVKAFPTGWLWIQITAWNVRVWSEEFEYLGGTATLTNNATNYVMIDWAGQIVIDTAGRNQQYVKIATITTAWGVITNIKQWRIDSIGWQLWGGGWFKNISNCIYKRWLLVYFIADWEEYNLTYERWRVKTITSWEKTYTMTYKWWKLVWSVES